MTDREKGNSVSEVRKYLTVVEETRTEADIDVEPPLRKVAVAAVVRNPYAGRFSEDLADIISPSEAIGDTLASMLVTAIGGEVQSYGKAAIVGSNGEVEHTHAFLTSKMADRFRAAIGGAKAWIPSNGKLAAVGERIDVPLACKDALFVRSHYDTITVAVPDAPGPDEVVVILAGANRGRPNFRLGGVRYEEIEGDDGLR